MRLAQTGAGSLGRTGQTQGTALQMRRVTLLASGVTPPAVGVSLASNRLRSDSRSLTALLELLDC